MSVICYIGSIFPLIKTVNKRNFRTKFLLIDVSLNLHIIFKLRMYSRVCFLFIFTQSCENDKSYNRCTYFVVHPGKSPTGCTAAEHRPALCGMGETLWPTEWSRSPGGECHFSGPARVHVVRDQVWA